MKCLLNPLDFTKLRSKINLCLSNLGTIVMFLRQHDIYECLQLLFNKFAYRSQMSSVKQFIVPKLLIFPLCNSSYCVSQYTRLCNAIVTSKLCFLNCVFTEWPCLLNATPSVINTGKQTCKARKGC